MKFRRNFRLTNTVLTNAGVQAEFVTSTEEALFVFLDWKTGGDLLNRLLEEENGEISVTFGRTPKVYGSAEVIKANV